MSTVPTVEIDGNDVTDEMQDRSLTIRRNAVDVTLIDPAVTPVVGDVLAITDPTWSGTVVQVESIGYRGDVPFFKVRATNEDTLTDVGAAPFDLDDGPPANFKDLVVTRTLKDAVTEVRAKCQVFTEGLEAGMEIDITSTVEGFSAETFTIMDLTTEYPIVDGATYTLDLGLGDFATATTSAADGGPLDPIRLDDAIVDVVRDAGCCDEGGGGGSGSASDSITDDFNRTVAASDWGTATCGLDWSLSLDDATAEVNGTTGETTLSIAIGDNGQCVATLDGVWRTLYNRTRSVKFRLDALPVGSTFLNVGGKMCGLYFSAHIDVRTGVGAPYSTFGFPASTTTAVATAFWVPGRTYTVTQVDDGTNITNTLSDGTTTYTVPKGAAATYAEFSDVVLSAEGETTGTAQDRTVYFEDLDVPEVTRNSVDRLTSRKPVHIEYTTLPATGSSPESQTADTYYDENFDATTSAALEPLGFTTADDITFTATRAGLVAIQGGADLDPTPTSASIVNIVCPTLAGGIAYKFSTNDTTTIPLVGTVWFNVGDYFRLELWGTVGDQPVTYAFITVARLD